MNQVVLIGNLTRDPELRYSTGTNQTAICRFTIAVNEGYGEKERTSFIPIVVFGKSAENCDRYLKKGSKVAVNGRLQTGSYVNKEGNKVYTTDVIANTYNGVEFLSSKGEGGQGNYGGGYNQGGFGQTQQGAFGGRQDDFGGPQGGFGQEQPFGAEPQQSAPQQESSATIPEGFQALQDDDIPF